MRVVLVVLIGVSVLVFVCASMFSNVKTWIAIGYLFGSLRRLPIAPRRRVVCQTALLFVVVGGDFALLIVHPLGLRNTFIWFLIVPFLVVVPLGLLAIGIHAWRRSRHDPSRSIASSEGRANERG